MNELLSGLGPIAALEDVLGIAVGGLLVVGVPMIAILTAHQRKMAEIMRRQPEVDSRLPHQLETMQLQINELRGLVQQLVIHHDSPQPLQIPEGPPRIEDRLKH